MSPPKTPSAVVCDDDVMVRGVVRGVLEQAGFSVLAEVGVVTELIDVVAATQPAVVILDISLPGMSGIEGLEALRSASSSTKIAVFSAFDMDDDLRDRIDAFVPKPDFAALENVLVAWLPATT